MRMATNEINNNASNVTIGGSDRADTINNTNCELDNVTIDAKGGNDYISTQTNYSSISGGDGNDTIYNYYTTEWFGNQFEGNVGGQYNTLDGGDGDDSIKNESDNVLILGGSDNDVIINNGAKVTIDGGGGNDTVAISDDFGMHQGNVYEYRADGGHDVLTNYGNDDTIRLVGVSLDGGVTGIGNNDRDIILQVGNGTITIKKGKGKEINIQQDDAEDPYLISAPESISNDEADAEIVTGNLNDYVENRANGVRISTGGGADYIYNSGSNVEADAGDGNDTVKNDGANAVINGGDGDDLLENRGANSTLIGGTGDDTINLGAATRVQYARGDGNDVIIGYDSDSTIHITSGTIGSIVTDGLDVVIKVGDGSLRIKDAFEQMLTIVKADNSVIRNSYGDYDINNVSLYQEVNGTKNANKIKNIGDGATINWRAMTRS